MGLIRRQGVLFTVCIDGCGDGSVRLAMPVPTTGPRFGSATGRASKAALDARLEVPGLAGIPRGKSSFPETGGSGGPSTISKARTTSCSGSLVAKCGDKLGKEISSGSGQGIASDTFTGRPVAVGADRADESLERAREGASSVASICVRASPFAAFGLAPEARAGASTLEVRTCASTLEARTGACSPTVAEVGSNVFARTSQAGHSRSWGAISRPHSGQIQWNMSPMYTDIDSSPLGRLPYAASPGTLRHPTFHLSESGGCVPRVWRAPRTSSAGMQRTQRGCKVLQELMLGSGWCLDRRALP